MNYFDTAIEVIKKINYSGYEAYFVGGYVRDYLLKIESNDIDITTSALPEVIKELFPNHYQTGIKYNTVVIEEQNFKYEITTYREDLEYLDNRHPIIKTSNKLECDLKRRDFTINALAMDVNQNIIDLHGGIRDLNNKVIRAINDPNERFKEDSLRILRAFYFVSKLGFTIEESTFKAIVNNASLVLNISSFRLIEEMNKIIINNKDNICFKLMRDTLVHTYLNGLEEGISSLLAKNIIINETLTFYSYCFYFSGKVNDKWTFSNDFINKINKIVYLVDKSITKYDILIYGIDIVRRANIIKKYISKDDFILNLDILNDTLIIKDLKDLKVTSKEIIEIFNIKPGKWIKEIKEKVIIEVLEGRLKNDKDSLLSYIKKEAMAWKI